MKQINDCSDGIYEELVDTNYKEVEIHISKLKNILEELNQSIQDDLETTT
jgi:1,2-phenylacetyl-CoA epoxidase catalytic subunit